MQTRMYGYNFSNDLIDWLEEIMDGQLSEQPFDRFSEYLDAVEDECDLDGIYSRVPAYARAELEELIESMAKDFWNGEYERTEGKSKGVY